MKLLKILFLVLTQSILWARMPNEDESIVVELKSGVSQTAKFVGVERDTLLLGGYIKNEFAIVRVPSSSILSIQTKSGEALEIPLENSSTNAPSKISSEETLSEETIDSLNPSPKDSLKEKNILLNEEEKNQSNDLNALSEDESPKENPEENSPSILSEDSASSHSEKIWISQTLLVPFSRRPIDSLFAENLQSLFLSLLREENISGIIPDKNTLDDCSLPSCLLPLAFENGANGIFFGEIIPAKNDSLQIQLNYFKQSGKEPEEASFVIAAKAPLGETLRKNLLADALQNLLGKAPPEKQEEKIEVENSPKLNFISVETEPDGAELSQMGEVSVCKTPCTFATQDTGSIDVYAYWDVEDQIWAKTARLKIIPGDTVKAYLRLRRVEPAIQIITHPEGADIYPDVKTITPFTARLGVSPKILHTRTLGEQSFRIFKEGFRDTVASLHVFPGEQNRLEVELSPLTLSKEIEDQQKMIAQKKKKTIGFSLMGASLVPVILGGVFTYLGQKDYDKARTLREELKKPHVNGGSAYKEKLKENKEKAERGDTRTFIGVGGFALAIGLLATGFIISF